MAKDTILTQVGEFGLYQKLLCGIFVFYTTFLCGLNYYTQVCQHCQLFRKVEGSRVSTPEFIRNVLFDDVKCILHYNHTERM